MMETPVEVVALLGKVDQCESDQRGPLHIKAALTVCRKPFPDTFLLLRSAETSQILLFPIKAYLTMDNLQWLSQLLPDKSCPEHCMPVNNLLPRILKGINAEFSMKVAIYLHEIQSSAGIIKSMKQQALLQGGERIEIFHPRLIA